jgi:peptidoglycan/LPS O-acetylase OafA/YrhL
MPINAPIINSNTQYLIRGLCAFIVFVGHYFMILDSFGICPSVIQQHSLLIYNTCRICITGFFVSSGFYIAINLAAIKEKNNAVGFYYVKTFWIKRILRIWPTYYVLILLAIFVLTKLPIFHIDKVHNVADANVLDTPSQLIYFFAMLPQVLNVQKISLDYADLAWSVGVEEIFYLIIPFVFFYSKHYLKIIISLFISYFILKLLVCSYFSSSFSNPVKDFINLSEYENIFWGSMVGILVFRFPSLFNQITKQYVYASIAVIFLLLSYYTKVPVTYLPIAIAFSVIFSFYYNKEALLSKFKPMVFLGKISLSLYAFHQLGIVLCINLFKNYINIKENTLLFFIIILPVSISISTLAYKLIEEPFLKKKNVLNYQLKTA